MMQRSHLVGNDYSWQRPIAVAALPRVAPPPRPPRWWWLAQPGWRQAICALVLVATLAGGGVGLWRALAPAHAGCPTYTIRWGDTMWQIAARFHTDTWTLARLNHIANPNLIIAGQTICVAATPNYQPQPTYSDPLQWSNRPEVRAMLIAAADRHGLPRNLVLAIGWRESSWVQHVISWDGGVGTMQLMSYTTAWLNGYLGTQYNPDRLYDNIELGVSYLAILWRDFRGYLPDIISAYNEGERGVRTYGIFNWWYVNSVFALMRAFG